MANEVFENGGSLGQPSRPVHEDSNPDRRDRPGAANIILWGALGCGSLVLLMCGVAGIGGVAWFMTSATPQAPVFVDLNQSETDSADDFTGADGVLPKPALEIAAPQPPSSRYEEIDLAKLASRELLAGANQFYALAKYEPAVQFQYQYVMKTQAGQYNLACYYGRTGNIPASLYWLQVAGREDGVDVGHASRDVDLAEVRMDSRWPKIRSYLRGCQRYWEKSGYSETTLVLPQNSVRGTPIPVLVGLHGFASSAREFINTERYQELADQMGAAFLGVSGTHCRGKHSFVWAEDETDDLRRVDAAFQEVAGQLTPAEGQIVLFGFSQGGMIAAELAGRDPQRFAGAILLSPGSTSSVFGFALAPQAENQRQGLVAVCGAGEHPETIRCTTQYASLYETFGRRVHLKLYPEMNRHTFPPDFTERFPIWCKFILDPSAPKPE